MEVLRREHAEGVLTYASAGTLLQASHRCQIRANLAGTVPGSSLDTRDSDPYTPSLARDVQAGVLAVIIQLQNSGQQVWESNYLGGFDAKS